MRQHKQVSEQNNYLELSMSTPIYTNDYKRNLILYWRQFYPQWTIPQGYHVHHIKPKSLFKDKNDSRIHHPKNLIALHVDDHVTIHKCRGDSTAKNNFIRIAGHRRGRNYHSSGMSNKSHSEETKLKIGDANRGRVLGQMSQITKDKISQSMIGHIGVTHSDESKRKISEANKGKVSPNLGKSMSAEQKHKLSKAALGKKFYNNGKECRQFYPDNVPLGYKLGRLKKTEPH